MEWMHGFHSLVGEGDVSITSGQMSVRALILFVYGILATRLGAWRAFGRWSSPDILVAVIIGSNLSRSLTGSAPLVPTMVATSMFILAYWLVSLAASRSDRFDRLVKGIAVPLVVNGVIDSAALRRSVLSKRDLDEALREKGVAETDGVVAARLERNGTISVIRDKDV